MDFAKDSSLNTKEIIDRIFKDPSTKYELTEFENLGKPIHDILSIYPKTAATGRDAGKIKYYMKSFIPVRIQGVCKLCGEESVRKAVRLSE